MVQSGWNEVKQSLEEESKFLHDVIPGFGIAYESLIRSYDNPTGSFGYRDRGFGDAKRLIELLSVTSKEPEDIATTHQKPPVGKHPSGQQYTQGNAEVESGYFPRLLRLTASAVPYNKSMEVELGLMRRVKGYLDDMRDVIYHTVPDSLEKREGKPMLLPEEYVKLVEDSSAIRAYFDYRAGRSYLNMGVVVDEAPIAQVVGRLIPSVDAFEHKWQKNQHWDLYPGNAGVDQFGFINLTIVDSLDNSTLVRSLESDDPRSVLMSYVPRQGIDNVIFRPNRQELRKEMRDDLRFDRQRDNMCIASMIKRRGQLSEYIKYKSKVKKILNKKGLRFDSDNLTMTPVI